MARKATKDKVAAKKLEAKKVNPKKAATNRPAAKKVRLKKAATKKVGSITINNDELLTFLRRKGVMADESEDIRDLEFEELLEAGPTTLVLAYPVQRVQRGGLCYMHALVVVQHYLVSMRTKLDAGMIDMAAMMRDTWCGEELTRHIFDTRGGNARTMLEHILVEGSVTTSQVSWDRFRGHLKKFGPALVTTFKVHDDFYFNTRQGIFDGVVRGAFKGHHAMALIGARTDEKGKRWFLLQNWWRNLQFVEVSESYLESSGATVCFVKTPQPHIPTSFPQCNAAYGESDFDKEESYSMDEGLLSY